MNCGIAIFMTAAVWLGATTVSFAWPQSEQEEAVRSTSGAAPAESSSAKSSRVLRSERADVENFTQTRLGISLLKNLTLDQRDLWTSPAKLRLSDADWLVPAGGLAAGLFVTDRDVSLHLSHNPKTISRYNTLSNAGIAALVGGAGGMWLLGQASHNAHWTETGLLAGEAALNSLAMVEGLKYTLRRERPFQGDGSGSLRSVIRGCMAASTFPLMSLSAESWAISSLNRSTPVIMIPVLAARNGDPSVNSFAER